MANGRCRLHGGATQRGDDWHRPRWPDRNTPDATAKLGRKLADQQKAAKRKQRRLAAMSPEERAAHDAWQHSHRSGSAKRRAALREERRQALEARALLSVPASVLGEAPSLADEIAAARARLREHDRQAELADAITNATGVFG